jgi:hypothetical protein
MLFGLFQTLLSTQKATICIICQVRIQEPEKNPPNATFPPFLAAGDREI